jgi:hypothetical protein
MIEATLIEAPDVVFDEDNHTYTLGGVRCPRSVTGLLKKYGLTTDFSQIPPRILELAKQRGIAYAEGRKLILKGYELDPATVDPRIECYLTGLRKWLRESNADIIETEVPHVSPLGYGFRADMFCWINGRRACVDDKCTFKLAKSIGPQTGGYKIGWNSLYPGQPVEDRYALHLLKDGTYRFKLLNDPDDEPAFMDVLDEDIDPNPSLTRWRRIEKWRKKYGE